MLVLFPGLKDTHILTQQAQNHNATLPRVLQQKKSLTIIYQ